MDGAVLTIGSLRLPHPFVQAALSGYSDLPMRRVARHCGAVYCVNEVVIDRSVLHDGAWQRQLLSVPEDDHPVGAQIMGADPAAFGPAARRLADAGYDVIDINFGCPVKKVLKRCRGGFLLGDPETALAMVHRVLDAVGGDKPVTVKMRRGIDESAESERCFFAILEGAFEAGVDAITVHGRTVHQRYSGPSNWAFLRKVKAHVGPRTILGSGDLMTAADCLAMMRETGVDGVTIARGALGNPWVFRECLALHAGEPRPPAPSVAEQGEILRRHLAEGVAYYGPDEAGRVLARTGIRYARRHPQAKRVRAAFSAVKSTADFEAVLRAWYAAAAVLTAAAGLEHLGC